MNGPGMISMNAAGGPVGGGPVINQAAARQEMNKEDQKRLNTYIYDYLLKNEQYDLARIFHQKFPILTAPVNIKSSPGKRDVNGVDEMDTDSKDALKRPQDLPEPSIPSHGDGSCFLFDWWCQFWEIYGARNNRSGGTPTADYLQHNISQQRARAQGQQRLLQQNDQRMMGMQGYNNLMMQQNPAMMNEMMAKQRATVMGQRNANPHQLQQMQQQKMMANQMQRDGSGMDMGGQRPQSPMGNTPSPSKRPRLDDGSGFGGQPMGPAGRGQPMSGPQMNNMAAAAGPNAPGQMLLQNGINPDLQQQQMAAFSSAPNMQPKLEAMNANGIPQPNQMGGQMDGSMDFNMNAQRAGAGGASQSGGNHALQDYQMQLMLLEQQNKKRLLMARQEQDNVSNHPGQVPQAGANFMAPAMSPSGSRAGPSPGPNEQMRKGLAGTPKMGGPGVPGSPMPDMGQNRASPAPNFDPGQIPPQYYAQMSNNMIGQPPSSHPRYNIAMANMNPQQMEQIQMNGRRMPNGAPWPQGGPQQMIQQQPGQQQPGPNQPQMGTPQQARGNMPPPPAPASQEQQQRTQPSSPAQQGQAPPTPSQAPKANPKGKKDGAAKAAKKQKNPPKKAGATSATPAAENAEAPTPTPSTPITPMHPNSFNKGQNGNAPQPPPNQQQPPAQQPPAPAPAAPPVAEPPMGMDANASFGMFEEGGDNAFNLDFNMNMDSSDVLDSFDFDALLNPDGFSFGNEGGLEVQ